MRVSRRSFLHVSAVSGGGMVLGMYVGAPKALAQSRPQPPFEPKAFIKIASDGTSGKV